MPVGGGTISAVTRTRFLYKSTCAGAALLHGMVVLNGPTNQCDVYTLRVSCHSGSKL